ncbi:MAG: hypothetical protein DIU52_012365 [bacterium]|jgi:hypothetical protein|nr:MAG: hypothetical protein DIU52_02385 [bacterium]
MTARVNGLIVPLVLAALLSSSVLPAFAQAGPADDPAAPSGRKGLAGHRRYILGAVGLAIGAVPALFVPSQSSDRRGTCATRGCVTFLAGTMGAVAGYLMGRDMDRAAAARAARGPELRLPTQRVELELVPETVDAFESGAIVVGSEGIVMVDRDRTTRRGGTIRGVRAVAALPAHDAMLAATTSGIYSFALSGSEGDGRLVLRGDGVALEPVAADQVVLSSSNLLRRLRLSGHGALLELTEEARLESDGLSTAFAYAPQTGILWAVSGDRVVARTTQLEEIGSVALPAIGRTISLSGGRALVAAGTAGLFLLDVQQPSAPRVLAQVRGIGFAFDAVLDGDTAYVAGGRAGLLVLDVTDPTAPRVVGAASNLGFVSSVALAPDGQVYVTDREGARLFVVQPRASGQAARER